MDLANPLPARTAAELKRRIDIERSGSELLLYRDGSGEQVLRELEPGEKLVVGRGEETDIDLSFDTKVSRVHAELERVGAAWFVIDDGLSRNGSFVNGERISARRRLRDEDVMQLISDLEFGDLANAAIDAQVFGHQVSVCSFDHLVAMKEAAGRDEDLLDLKRLREARGEQSGAGEGL